LPSGCRRPKTCTTTNFQAPKTPGISGNFYFSTSLVYLVYGPHSACAAVTTGKTTDFVELLLARGQMMPRQYLTAGIIFCLIVCFACQAALGADPKRVLIIDSFGRDFAPWNEYAKRFRADLDREWSEPIDLYETSLAIPRFSHEGKDSEFKESQFTD